MDEKIPQERLYSIGEAAELVNLTRKTLRFYDSIGLLEPDKIGENGYRYYTKDKLLLVPVIKYYRQMGFQIEEMRDLIRGATFGVVSRAFVAKLAECMEEQIAIQNQYAVIMGWHNLILEALEAIEHTVTEVGVRFFNPITCLALRQPYKPDYRDAVINLEFSAYIESLGNVGTGPVIRCFDSVEERIAGLATEQVMLQETLKPCEEDQCVPLGGTLMLFCYHLGDHTSLLDTYRRMREWAVRRQYQCGPRVYERFVSDYWLTNDESRFVTEVIMEITR